VIGQSSNQRGFTLIELMVVIIIAAILLTIAVPSFSSLIKRNNVDSLQSKLSSALATARTEAASRNKVITICRSNDEATCIAGAVSGNVPWSTGWIIFEDDDNDGVVDEATATTPAETLIDVYRNNGGYTIKASNGKVRLSFNSQGFTTDAGNALLTICEPDNDDVYARGLFVNRSGLVMKTRDTNSDGKHNDPTSTNPAVNLNCP
jgi:type IV fimbrial biogenesis protein FimT